MRAYAAHAALGLARRHARASDVASSSSSSSVSSSPSFASSSRAGQRIRACALSFARLTSHPRAVTRASAKLAPPTTRHIDGLDAYVSATARIVPPVAFVACCGVTFATAVAFLFGCLLTMRELVRACREATLASRAVRNCSNAIDAACTSVQRCTANIDATCANVDAFVEQANAIGSTTSNILTEAGLLQRQVTDLPNALLGSLGLSSDGGKVPRSMLASTNAEVTNADERALRDIVLGKEISGRRLGNGWIGSTWHRFFFSRDNTFSVGEYVAVKRSAGTYTWGVIEMTDGGSADEGDDASSSIDPNAPPAACEWPPRYLAAEDAEQKAKEARKITPGKIFKSLIRMPLPGALGQPERQYRVVVAVDRELYRFKYVDAGLLGKRY